MGRLRPTDAPIALRRWCHIAADSLSQVLPPPLCSPAITPCGWPRAAASAHPAAATAAASAGRDDAVCLSREMRTREAQAADTGPRRFGSQVIYFTAAAATRAGVAATASRPAERATAVSSNKTHAAHAQAGQPVVKLWSPSCAAVNDELARKHDVIVTVRALADQLRRRVRKSDKLPKKIWSCSAGDAKPAKW